jgi:hypothetical protein
MFGLGCSRFARRYLGNRACFLFLQVLRCFTSLSGLRDAYVFSVRYHGIPRGELPHSGIFGSRPAGGSPKLIAACYALLRLLMPGHPPYTLSSLTKFAPDTHVQTEVPRLGTSIHAVDVIFGSTYT